ncbi:hypothetical protein LPN04_29440 [Rugamonas sp. A1-17]|nr:hypothetical protein [Rugamonas sp. A1-17]
MTEELKYPSVRLVASEMKEADKIERINSKFSERVVAEVVTWQCSRVFRRDFNRMTYKMFLLSSKFNSQQRIILRLHEMQTALHVLQNLVNKMPASSLPAEKTITKLPMRLVSPEAKILFDALVTMDAIMACLLSLHDEQTTDEICSDFFAAYGRLKHALFKNPPARDQAPAGGADQLEASAVATAESIEVVPAEPQHVGLSIKLRSIFGSLRKHFSEKD